MTDFGLPLLAQSVRITNWFSTSWLISVGFLIGMLLVGLYLLKVWAMSKIGGLNRVGESRTGLVVAGLITGTVLSAAAIWFLIYIRGWATVSTSLTSRGDGFLTLIFPAAICYLIGFGHWVIISRKRSSEVIASVREGLMGWVQWIMLGVCLFAVTGYGLHKVDGFGLIRFIDDADAVLHSLTRLPASGLREFDLTLPVSKPGSTGEAVLVNFPGEEFREARISSNQQVDIAARPITVGLPLDQMFQIPSTSATDASRVGRGRVIPDGQIEVLYFLNTGRNPATINFTYVILPVYPEVLVMPITAMCTLLFYLLYMSYTALFPKIAAIGLATFQSEVSQPIFYLIMASGIFFIVVSIFLPYNTFGEDIKMYKDSGLTLIRVLAIFVAIWASSKSVAEEIEGRTALTVLSKPVGRRQFIMGKIMGISQVIALIFIVLGIWFIFWTGYKPVYDAVETSRTSVEWTESFMESTSVIPALALAFLEAFLFVVISVMISTRLGILPNLVICFAIYILGHMTPLLVLSSKVVNNFEPVVFFGRLIAIVFPVLDNFNVEAAIMTNSSVPISYMLISTLYAFLYGTIAVLLSLVFFEDRDLA